MLLFVCVAVLWNLYSVSSKFWLCYRKLSSIFVQKHYDGIVSFFTIILSRTDPVECTAADHA